MKLIKLVKKHLLLILFAIMITTVSIINRQSFIKTLPTLISLIVQVLLVAADRKAFMVGGLNSILYGISYTLDGVYFSAIYAFLISFPVQIYSFFNWKKNSTNNKVQFKVLGKVKLPITIAVILAVWAGVYFGLSRFFANATLPIVDTLIFTLGVVCTFLSAFRYVDSQYVSLINSMISLIMWIMITVNNPASFNYIIISVYNTYRVAQATVSWTRQYRSDKNELRNTQPAE